MKSKQGLLTGAFAGQPISQISNGLECRTCGILGQSVDLHYVVLQQRVHHRTEVSELHALSFRENHSMALQLLGQASGQVGDTGVIESRTGCWQGNDFVVAH